MCVVGCGQATVRMDPGTPVAVERGYCLVNTKFKQRGHLLNRDDVMQHLERSEKTRSYVAQGNALAIGSIISVVVATPAIIIGASAKQGEIQMNDDASTALLAGGIAVGVASWALCIASDGKYVSAVDAYNEHFTERPEPDVVRVDEY